MYCSLIFVKAVLIPFKSFVQVKSEADFLMPKGGH